MGRTAILQEIFYGIWPHSWTYNHESSELAFIVSYNLKHFPSNTKFSKTGKKRKEMHEWPLGQNKLQKETRKILKNKKNRDGFHIYSHCLSQTQY